MIDALGRKQGQVARRELEGGELPTGDRDRRGIPELSRALSAPPDRLYVAAIRSVDLNAAVAAVHREDP